MAPFGLYMGPSYIKRSESYPKKKKKAVGFLHIKIYEVELSTHAIRKIRLKSEEYVIFFVIKTRGTYLIKN
jgi:hypothetical protein